MRVSQGGKNENFNDRADELLEAGRYDYAVAFLHVALLTMPPGWRPRRKESASVTIAFWNEGEFRAFTSHEQDRMTGSVRRERESFSKAWCQLARALRKLARFDDALFAVNSGLELEPHPTLWNAKGSVLNELNRREHWSVMPGRHQSAHGRRPNKWRPRFGIRVWRW